VVDCRKSAIYRRFLGIALTKSFAMFRCEDERHLNTKNARRMNCVNIVESAGDGRRGAQNWQRSPSAADPLCSFGNQRKEIRVL